MGHLANGDFIQTAGWTPSDSKLDATRTYQKNASESNSESAREKLQETHL